MLLNLKLILFSHKKCVEKYFNPNVLYVLQIILEEICHE